MATVISNIKPLEIYLNTLKKKKNTNSILFEKITKLNLENN